ncbi:hypothetical protein [Streptomyces sp. PU-14G]|uniref:hypothetical protein n=1 Tax=Streptomyces sp. PU-14G TaxID=2800808 RepID=UPI0034DFF483
MNVAEKLSSSAPVPVPRASFKRRFAREVGAAAVLLPAGLLALVAALAGRTRSALGLLRARTEPDGPRPGTEPDDGPRTGTVRLVVHAVLTVLLGVLALLLVGMLVLFVARGVLYGFVDDGPYDTSWGGPSRAGAWLAHFAVGCPVAVAATGLLYGLAGLHRRMTAPCGASAAPAGCCRRCGWAAWPVPCSSSPSYGS